MDFPLGIKNHVDDADESAISPVKGSDNEEDVDGDMAKAVKQMNMDATLTPASSTMSPTPGSTHGRLSASNGGSATPASTSDGPAPVVGSVTTATAMSDEWAFVNAAAKGNSYGRSNSYGKSNGYGKGKLAVGNSPFTTSGLGSPRYTAQVTVGTAGGTTPTTGSASRKVGGWVKEKARPPVDNEWGWGACVGGQPRWFKKKQGGKNNDYGDDLDEDDGEEV